MKRPKRARRSRGGQKRGARPRRARVRVELHALVRDRGALCRAIARRAKIPRSRAEELIARADVAGVRVGHYVRGFLEPAVRALGFDAAVVLLEKEDLQHLSRRCRLLAELDAEALPVCRVRDLAGWQEAEDEGGVADVPGYGKVDFAPRGAHLVCGRLDHLAEWYRQQYRPLVATGHADGDFVLCPWLNRMLGRLCPDLGGRAVPRGLRERLLGFRIRTMEAAAEELRKGDRGEPRRRVCELVRTDPVAGDLDDLLQYDREEFDRDEAGRAPGALPGYGGAITNLATVVAYLEHEVRARKMDAVARKLRGIAEDECARVAAVACRDPQEFMSSWRDPLRDARGATSYFAASGKPWRDRLDEALDGFGEALRAARGATPHGVLGAFLGTAIADTPAAKPNLSRSTASVWQYIEKMPVVPTYDDITSALQMGRRTVSKALTELRAKGLLPPRRGTKTEPK